MSHPTTRSLVIIYSLLAATLLVAGMLGFNKWRFDSQSRELAITINQAVLSSGDARLLIDHAHPLLLEQMDASSLQGYVSAVTEILGPLQAINAISGATPLNPLSLLRGTTSASYTLQLQFEAEQTRALIELQRSDGQWQVSSYLLDSELLYN